ncbi:MAG: benzoate/H(+) symporter BenE family transporter [Rhizobiales bacterium]|nr:benzoate/H(+) symporter BenE family transporter [Hyphomicrobiales bacterium]
MDDGTRIEAAGNSLVQPLSAGILASLVGFASSVPVLVAGLTAAGASPAEAASGLFAICLAVAVLGIGLSVRSRMPVTIAWSTPGAALLVSTGTPTGGYPATVAAFLAAAALIVVAGLWKPFGRAVAAIPMSLANAMLAGILLELCLAPLKAVEAMPLLALPIILVWAVAMRFLRRFAVPISVVVTAIIVVSATTIPPAALAASLPKPILVLPAFDLNAIIGIGLPLFLVTMASQNVTGLAVLNANGYRPAVGPIFTLTGLASIVTGLFGGHTVNLAAITAALCAGPEAGADPARRWIASVACSVTYLLLGFGAAFAAAFIAASPPLLIQAVAGLALLGSLASALSGALNNEADRLPAAIAFVTTASGVSFYGIGSAFWGLAAGGLLMALLRWRPTG